MRKSALILFSFIITNAVAAQVRGIVIDSAAKKPLDKVAVGMVVKSNPTDTIYTFSDEKGLFSFDIVPASNFSVIIRNLGYLPVAKFIPVNRKEKAIDVGAFVLTTYGKTLGEVVVSAPPIIIKEDTVEYNASSFTVKENAVVEDLLKKLPGIKVDKDGNVTAQGKSVTKVKVNGKDFFGGDVKTATRELPANIVDKIQIIDDYGDQATVSGIKEGESEKVLNIQIRKDRNKGFFGRATGGVGTNDRYQASFNGNYFNNNRQFSMVANSNNTNVSLFDFAGGNRGFTSMMRTGMKAMADMGGMNAAQNIFQSGIGQFNNGSNGGISSNNAIGFNYRDQWSPRVSIYGSFSYAHRNTDQQQSTAAQNFYESAGFLNRQETNGITKNDSYRATFNIEYQADSFNYLKISPTFTYSGNDAINRALFVYSKTDGTKTSDGSNTNLSNSKAPNISTTVLYNHKFRKRGRNFSASISYGNSESNSTQDITNLSYQYTSPGTGPGNLFQYIDQENNNHNYGIRFTYSEPLSKTRSLDLTLSHNLNYARNNKQAFNVDSATQVKTLNNFLSDDYENNFYNDRLGLSLRTTKKKYNYSVGLTMQPVALKGNSITKDSSFHTITRINVFPIARMTYNFSKTKSLSATYTGNATQPTFAQLQPVIDFSNPQSITAGNPELKAAMNHNLNVSFNRFNFFSGKVLFTNVNFSLTNNQIVNKTARIGNAGSSISIPENVNGYYNVNGFYAWSRPYKNRKYVLTLTGTANFNHNVNLTDSISLQGANLVQELNKQKIIGQNWIVSQGFTFEFNYKHWLEFGAGVSYAINDNKYRGAGSNDISYFRNTSSNAWTFSSNINMDLTKTLVLKYDFDFTINSGLSDYVSKNPAIMTASLEKQLFKKKNGVLKLTAYDLFKQNSNISRNVSANSIIDTRSNRLTRYFLLTFSYRLQKFRGTQGIKNESNMPGSKLSAVQ